MPPEEGTAAWRLRACPPDCRGAYRRIPGIDRARCEDRSPAWGSGARLRWRGMRRAVVVKLGSSTLVDGRRRLRRARLARIASELVALQLTGTPVCVVSSGAIALGLGSLDRDVRPTRRAEPAGRLGGRPGPAAGAWQRALAGSARSAGRRRAAQVLLTADDVRRRTSYLNARATLEALLRLGRRPDRQRERLDGDRRDHVRRQRRARRAGRAAAARAPARAADRRRRPLHARPARQGRRARAARCTTARCSPSSTSTPPRRAASARAACARRSSRPRWRRAAASPA